MLGKIFAGLWVSGNRMPAAHSFYKSILFLARSAPAPAVALACIST